MNVLPLT